MIQWCTLRVVGDGALPAVREFYGSVLGMQEEACANTEENCARFRYRFASRPHSAGLELITATGGSVVRTPYRPSREDLYWKIGLSLADVNSAVEVTNVRSSAARVGKGSQFEDIGFLTHMADPQGFAIELLQTTFESNSEARAQQRAACKFDPGQPLAQTLQPVLGQVTLRISDPERSLSFYEGKLGMKLISVQPVSKYGFTLYFLAPAWYLELGCPSPPAPELTAVELREWCWQLPFTTLELQHRHGASQRPLQPPLESGGFHSLTVGVAAGVVASEFGGQTLVEDPDGTRIVLEVVRE